MKRAATFVAAVALAGASGAAVATAVADEQVVTEAVTLPEGWVYGPCGGELPPWPDPCLGVQGMAGAMFGNIVNATQYKNWAKANPGEVQRLVAFMAAPMREPISMRTFLGQALTEVVQMNAYAKGGPLVLPLPNVSLDPKRPDKSPPTAPGGITVVPPPPPPPAE